MDQIVLRAQIWPLVQSINLKVKSHDFVFWLCILPSVWLAPTQLTLWAYDQWSESLNIDILAYSFKSQSCLSYSIDWVQVSGIWVEMISANTRHGSATFPETSHVLQCFAMMTFKLICQKSSLALNTRQNLIYTHYHDELIISCITSKNRLFKENSRNFIKNKSTNFHKRQ